MTTMDTLINYLRKHHLQVPRKTITDLMNPFDIPEER
jgi:hypothetical protein